MKKFKILALVSFILFSLNAFAHTGGHGTKRSDVWTINNQKIEGSFLKSNESAIFLQTNSGNIKSFSLKSFSEKDQKILNKKIAKIASINHSTSIAKEVKDNNNNFWTNLKNNSIVKLTFWGLILFLPLPVFLLKKRKTSSALLTSFLSLFFLIAIACDDSDTNLDTISAESEDDRRGGGGNRPTEEEEEEEGALPPNEISDLEEFFGQFSNVTTSSDDERFYISSDGLPDHEMMTGITNWQQQVPIPQNYTGDNSWSIPIQPVLAETPLLSSEHFMKGAIAIAVNGIPIFNPLNNRGEDAFEIGELDQWGGHCGRADDYHYHIPPIHLEPILGTDQPLAYALDGFPIYGETTEELDEYLGRFNEDGSYQYHTTSEFPYFIAGMRGEVELDANTTAPEDQIIPQASTSEVRPALTPLAGAEITAFSATGDNGYSLEYQIGTNVYYNNYSWDNNQITYEFVNPNGTTTTETYQRSGGGDGGGETTTTDIENYGDALIDRIEADTNPDGAGIDLTFRNSGLVIDETDNTYYAVNGVHPINAGDYSSYYPKSIVKASLDTDEIVEYWSFNAETLGHEVDMEGLTFAGEDRTTLYIGDEYNYIYEFDLTEGVVTREWNISDIAATQNGGIAIPVDKGIEAITYLDGYFYVGIQETGYIHKLDLNLDVTDPNDANYQVAEEISNFSAGISPSGLFAAADGTLYMVAVDGTGGDQFIYNFTTDGVQNCTLTIDSSISIARSDGIYIDDAEEYVYVADSQGPLFDGYSLYKIPWNAEDCQ